MKFVIHLILFIIVIKPWTFLPLIGVPPETEKSPNLKEN